MKNFKTKSLRSVVAILIVFSLFIGVCGNGRINVYADETVYAIGVVDVTSSLFLRSGPGMSNSVLVTMPNGSTIYISNQQSVDGVTWYYGKVDVYGTSYTGWCSGEYLSITMIETNSDYATQLRQEGFPESYIPYLCSLHAKYPEWTFKAVNTNLDWNYVISKESENKKNLVPSSYNDARKSTESFAYSYYTNTWSVIDGGRWVNAHPNYIRYRMDPRNYLNEANIFMFECSSFNEAQKVEGVSAILKGTWMETETIMKCELTLGSDGAIASVGANLGEVSYAQAIYDASKQLGLNPYHIASRIRQEQGVSKGALMSGTYAGYEGLYNIFNVGASGTQPVDVITSGLSFARAKGWDTPYKSIIGGASRLGTKYINAGQDTLYFQKFHVIDKNNPNSLFWRQYMQNVDAPLSEGLTLARSYADKTQAFVFKIPVYNNMPESPCTFVDTGNPNNYLSSLSLGNVSISPNFDGGRISYTAKVPYLVSSVTVSSSAVASTSKINGNRTVNLEVGDNTIVVNCTAQNGERRDYTIIVTRAAATEEDVPEYSSNKYSLGEIITGIQPGTTVKDFVDTFSLKNCEVKVYKADGSESTGNIGTGNKISIVSAGNEIAAFTTLVYGDVNGDGIINIIDLGMVDRYILNAYDITGMNLKACDVNRDGVVNIIDLGMIDRQILNAYTITQ